MKVVTSIKLQKKLHLQLQQRIIQDGYGMRGKSLWIVEAIGSFLSLTDYPTLVDIAQDMSALDDLVSIRMPDSLQIKMDEAIIHIRRIYPAMEGVKSNLIRASIMQRLLRGADSVTEYQVN